MGSGVRGQRWPTNVAYSTCRAHKKGRPLSGAAVFTSATRKRDYFLAGFSALLPLPALISETTSDVKSMESFEYTTNPTAFKD